MRTELGGKKIWKNNKKVDVKKPG